MEDRPHPIIRAFFTVLALSVVCLPVLALLSSLDGGKARWGTVPEWIGALSLVVIAAGVWRLGSSRDRGRNDRDAVR